MIHMSRVLHQSVQVSTEKFCALENKISSTAPKEDVLIRRETVAD